MMGKPPKAAVLIDRVRCTACFTAVFMLLGGALRALSLLLPWWLWVGARENDFWGVEPGVAVSIAPLDACSSLDPLDSGTCVALGSLVTFTIISSCSSWCGAVICVMIAVRVYSLALLLMSALIAVGSTTVGVIAIFMGMELQEENLGGIGFYLSLGAIGVDVTGAIFVIWGANKATPDADELRQKGPEYTGSWLERARVAQEAAAELARQLEAQQSSRRKTLKRNSGIIFVGNGRIAPASPHVAADPALPCFKKVISMGTGEKTTIPIELLEAAFGEIDDDWTGSITSEELKEAFEQCGLEPSSEAMDSIMHEIDKDSSGSIEVQEFVAFFKMLEDLGNYEEEIKSRGMFFRMVCNCCFLSNVLGVAFLVMMMAQEEDQTTESFGFLASIFRFALISLIILFICNIGAPMIRLTLGPSLDAWCELGKQYFKNRRLRKEEKQKEKQIQRRNSRRSAREARESRKEGGSPTSPESPSSRVGLEEAVSLPGSPMALMDGTSPRSPTSPHSLDMMSQSSPVSPVSLASPKSRKTFGSGRLDEETGETPGVYIVLHDKSVVRCDMSIKSKKVRTLRKGVEVRVVEVCECFEDGRIRGRLENEDEDNKKTEWVSLRDIEDDYAWAKRVCSLEGSSPKVVMLRKKGTEDLGHLAGDKRSPQHGKRKVQISPEELCENPAYDPFYYQSAWARAEDFEPGQSFCGTMQVQDFATCIGNEQQYPEDRGVQGGLAGSRGEWRLSLVST